MAFQKHHAVFFMEDHKYFDSFSYVCMDNYVYCRVCSEEKWKQFLVFNSWASNYRLQEPPSEYV
jgi:hypothetical protein